MPTRTRDFFAVYGAKSHLCNCHAYDKADALRIARDEGLKPVDAVKIGRGGYETLLRRAGAIIITKPTEQQQPRRAP